MPSKIITNNKQPEGMKPMTESTEPQGTTEHKREWEEIANGTVVFTMTMTKTGDDEVLCESSSEASDATSKVTYTEAEAAQIVGAIFAERRDIMLRKSPIGALLQHIFGDSDSPIQGVMVVGVKPKGGEQHGDTQQEAESGEPGTPSV